MVDTAAWLCDAVLPEVPVRQWVLSLPYRMRVLCAYDAAACALVRGVLVRAVSGFYERTAAREGVPRPRAGAVAFVQRFDSGLRLNVHFHVLWLDGVYGWAGVRDRGAGVPEVLRGSAGAGGDPRSGVARAGLRAMGLSSTAPEQAGCRPPPAGYGLDAAADYVAD
jgi:hypothetical protein